MEDVAMPLTTVLNSYTIKESHPLPRCDDVCDAANGAFALMHSNRHKIPVNLPQQLGAFSLADMALWGHEA